MITAGIDVGLENIKTIILKDGKIIGRACGLSGGAKRPAAVEAVYGEALKNAGLTADDVEKVVATGKGKFDVAFAVDRVTEPVTAAKAANFLVPGATTVVDIGADETLVATLVGDKIKEFVINQKCSAGLGLFLEHMAERFDMSIEEMSALDGPSEVVVNDGCVVFAELDALDHVNAGACLKEISKAIIEACAWRAYSVINDIYKPALECVVLTGGMTKNSAFVKALERVSGIKFVIPEEAVYAGAIGAALWAAA